MPLPTPHAPSNPDPRPWYQQVEIAVGKTVVAVIISPDLLGFDTHFIGKRTRPCPGMAQGCTYCTPEAEPRWIGYLLVWPAYAAKPERLQVTRGAYDNCPALQSAQGLLRGKTITVWRKGKSENAPMYVRLEPPTQFPGKPANLPPCQLIPHLERMWGVPRERPTERPTPLLDPNE